MLSSINDPLFVLLAATSSMLFTFAMVPAITSSTDHVKRFQMAIVFPITVGLTFGLLKASYVVISNRYLELKMYYLTLSSASSIVNQCLLISLGIALFALVTSVTTRIFLRVIALNRKASEIIVCGIAPSGLVFALGGYWINTTYLPGLLKLKSIAANALWALVCVLLLWAIGSILSKISRTGFSISPGIHTGKTLIVIVSLIVFSNGVTYFYHSSLKPDRPNLILISIDTLRADHLSSYGYSRETTPNVDRFARDGVLFANAITQSSWTLPSHMSLFTSLYPSSHGVIEQDSKLSNGHLTLAEILQDAGYTTVAFTDGYYLSHKFGYQGFDHFDDEGGGIEDIYNKAVDWLRKDASRPFFLFLHTYEPHCPYNPPPEYDIYSNKNYQGVVTVAGKCAKYYSRIKPRMNLEDYQYVLDKYDGEIYYIDRFLGKLFTELKDSGMYDESVVVFTSDHGENFSDHGSNITHLELYDEVVKVPLIMKAPKFTGSRIIDEQVQSIDIMPTVLELLGISIPSRINGRSLVKLVAKGSYDQVFAFSVLANT